MGIAYFFSSEVLYLLNLMDLRSPDGVFQEPLLESNVFE